MGHKTSSANRLYLHDVIPGVGRAVGIGVTGAGVGSDVGLDVGAAVGFAVVGTGVGQGVGFGVGFCVGTGVIAPVHPHTSSAIGSACKTLHRSGSVIWFDKPI